jgi:hypothetical protein
MDKAITSFLYGVALTLLAAIFPRAYCHCGTGFGWPFVIVHPWHYEEKLTVNLGAGAMLGLVGLVLTLVFWTVVAFTLRFWKRS